MRERERERTLLETDGDRERLKEIETEINREGDRIRPRPSCFHEFRRQKTDIYKNTENKNKDKTTSLRKGLQGHSVATIFPDEDSIFS